MADPDTAKDSVKPDRGPFPSEAWTLSAAGFLFMPLAVIAPLAIWILALAAASVVGFLRWPVLRESASLRLSQIRLPVLLALSFVAWAAFSSLWSIDPVRSLKTAARLLLVLAALLVLIDAARDLSDENRARLGNWLLCGVLAGFVLLAVMTAIAGFARHPEPVFPTVAALSHLSRATALVAILAWPAALIAGRRFGPWWAIGIVAAAALVCLVLPPRSAPVAFGAGALAFLIVRRFPGSLSPLFAIALLASAAVIPLMPALTPIATALLTEAVDWPASQVHRIAVWAFSADLILERPLTGWGLDTSRLVPGADQRLDLFHTPSGRPHTGEAMPLHPHNALVQIWLETGLVGLSLALAALLLVLRRCVGRAAQTTPATRAALAATAASAFTLAQLSFGIWQGWWMASLGLTAVLAAAAGPRNGKPATGARGQRVSASDAR